MEPQRSDTSPVSSVKKANDPSRLGVLSRPTLRAPSAVQHAKDAIINGMDIFEAEITQLRSQNTNISSNFDEMSEQMELMSEKLSAMECEKERVIAEKDAAILKQRKMEADYQQRIAALEQELVAVRESERRLREENTRWSKQLDDVANNLRQKEDDLRRLSRELESTRLQFEHSSKRHFHERDIELLHEVEMLKNQKREWNYERQEMNKNHKKLEHELKSLQEELESKDSVALKDSHVHGVLKREFNQLLEENNHLKLQLHRRGIAHNVVPGTTRTEQGEVTVIPVSHGSDARTILATGTRVHHASSHGSLNTIAANSSSSSSSARKASEAASNIKTKQHPKDYPLTARERTQISRSQTFTAPSKDRNVFRRNASFTIRDPHPHSHRVAAPGAGTGAGAGVRPGAASIQGRTASPHIASPHSTESLPALAHRSNATKTNGKA